MSKTKIAIGVIEIIIGGFFIMMTASDIQLGFGLAFVMIGLNSIIK